MHYNDSYMKTAKVVVSCYFVTTLVGRVISLLNS